MKIPLDLADVKPSVVSFVTVGLMALVFIVVGKWLTQKYRVPGLTDLFAAA